MSEVKSVASTFWSWINLKTRATNWSEKNWSRTRQDITAKIWRATQVLAIIVRLTAFAQYQTRLEEFQMYSTTLAGKKLTMVIIFSFFQVGYLSSSIIFSSLFFILGGKFDKPTKRFRTLYCFVIDLCKVIYCTNYDVTKSNLKF